MYSDAYKNALCLLCRQSAIVENYTRLARNGRKLNKKEVEKQLALFCKAKKQFLKAKEDLGFKDGISFMQKDAVFQGFSLKSGELTGDYEKLFDVVAPWTELEENEKNHYRYEVGILILSHYFMQKGLYNYEDKKLLGLLSALKDKVSSVFGFLRRKEA